MGNTKSNTEEKVVDTTGTVNNNLVLRDDQQLNIFSFEITLLLLIICVLKIIEFAYFIYRIHSRRLKKIYTNGVNNI